MIRSAPIIEVLLQQIVCLSRIKAQGRPSTFDESNRPLRAVEVVVGIRGNDGTSLSVLLTTDVVLFLVVYPV